MDSSGSRCSGAARCGSGRRSDSLRAMHASARVAQLSRSRGQPFRVAVSGSRGRDGLARFPSSAFGTFIRAFHGAHPSGGLRRAKRQSCRFVSREREKERVDRHAIIPHCSNAADPATDEASQDPRHQRPALRERPDPSRAHAREHPDRHLGAGDAHGRARGALRLRGRRARHVDHAARGEGRHHAAGTDRGRARAAQARPSPISASRTTITRRPTARRIAISPIASGTRWSPPATPNRGR